ncbi:MAG: nitroreductase family protein, partial [Alistipes sp.]|nr:nitroreductase family protein [Alistipes sp.]
VWAAAGVNRPESGRLTAPSALALYPIRTYVFLPCGVYAYDAPGHRLVRVAEGDRRALSGMQPFVAQAAANLVFIADREAYAAREGIPADHVRYLCGQDAAGYAENANLYAAGHGLKSVTRGSAPEAELLELLGLDPARYFFALAVSVGK